MYTDQSLFELIVANEDRDVWKIYLEKGQFDTALKYAKVGQDASFESPVRERLIHLARLHGKGTRFFLLKPTHFSRTANTSRRRRPTPIAQQLSKRWLLSSLILASGIRYDLTSSRD